MRTREIHLAARPKGEPVDTDFALVERELPDPAPGQVLVRNRFMSVDPYMRPRMDDVPSYLPPFQVGRVMEGGAVGEVVRSESPRFTEGDHVLDQLGWREHALSDAREFRKLDAQGVSLTAFLGALGMPGLTAYVGLVDIAQFKAGEIVYVSGAAGAIGGLVGQFAKLLGASRVIGSAGSDDKVAHVTAELGFDAAFNYHKASVRSQLRSAAPDGIDVYFDNVGGDHLEAAISSMRTHGRVAMCGAISQYNATTPEPGPRNLPLIIGRRLTLRGYIIIDHFDRMPAFLEQVATWYREGRIHAPETIVDGIENAPAAFLGLLHGENTGKMLVRIS
jgi:NADPH-dependent curcumin reductase CurA